MNYRFYDEAMHGRDWAAIREAYRPLLAHVGAYEDVYLLANLMIGELNASHTGVSEVSVTSAMRRALHDGQIGLGRLS